MTDVYKIYNDCNSSKHTEKWYGRHYETAEYKPLVVLCPIQPPTLKRSAHCHRPVDAEL